MLRRGKKRSCSRCRLDGVCGLLRAPARTCGGPAMWERDSWTRTGGVDGEALARAGRLAVSAREVDARRGVHVPSIGASGYKMRSRVMIEILKHSKI